MNRSNSDDSNSTPNLEATFIVDDRENVSRAPIELIEGTGPKLVTETQSLLHARLRAAAIVLLLAVGAFYVRGFFVPASAVRELHLFVTIGLGATFVFLQRRVTPTMPTLRRIEWLLFGGVTLFLGIFQFETVLAFGEEGNSVESLAAIKSSVMYVFGTIILYGTFIPNTWQRALKVVVPMACVPPAVMLLIRAGQTDAHELVSRIASFRHISDDLLILVLGVIASVYGTHTINELRRQAFKARQLGQYRLKQLLGTGGMGEVYLAEHQLLKRPCAVKLIRPSHQTNPQALARFEREVRLTSALTHSNTITIFDYGRTPNDTFYYVMEFLHGMSLYEIVKRFAPLPPARAVHFLRQACGSLHEAHAAGLIHRDIKPANLFAAQLGGRHDVLKVLDFGLVRAVGKSNANGNDTERGLSGSPLYMSPEEASPDADRPPDHRGDIYSLGATAYFLLTGRPPFTVENSVAALAAHLNEPPRPLRDLREDVPADLEQVVLRCLAKNPAERFTDVEELDKTLAACDCAGRWTSTDAADWWRQAIAAS